MEKFNVIDDIAKRTNGDIFIGVVGPVRTGKSTFVSKFTEQFIIPNIVNKLERDIAVDEMPQSGAGKSVMTTQPKFVPSKSVKVSFSSKATFNARIIDCVGYFVEGAEGSEENGEPRMVKTPWSDKEMPFIKAAETGTKKVISEYSTIGIMMTTDGTIGEIPRLNYESAEEKTVKELKRCNKPFIIVLNSKNPESVECKKLADALEEKYGVSVCPVNALNLNKEDISAILERVVMEFPIKEIDVEIPKWLSVLPPCSPIISNLLERLKSNSLKMNKMKDFSAISECFDGDENYKEVDLKELSLGEGKTEYKVVVSENLFYKTLSDECEENIDGDYELMKYIKSFSKERKEYQKIASALHDAKETGYGIVLPSADEMDLKEPALVKQGGKFGVKLCASAPSLHIMKVDVCSEVSPLVGTEKQGEDLVKYMTDSFSDNPEKLWDTDMFGKSLHDLMNENLSSKINSMPKDAQEKMRKTVTRIVNESKGGVICILL